MKIRMRSVSQVLLGLDRIGLVGLERTFQEADESRLTEREELVSLMMEALSKQNYIPSASHDKYRHALWREYLRHRGEDIRDLYSEIEVVIRSEPGPELDRFLETVVEVFAKYELKPVIELEPPDPLGPNPQLRIREKLVVAGTTDPERIGRAVGRQISDW